MSEEKRGSATADYGKTASFLAVGVGLTGLITYAYFLIASHVLSKPDYGQITVLWSAVFITISTLYRPIEQLLSRHISERRVKGQSMSEPMRVASTIQFGLSLFFAVLALALRGPIQNGLLEGNETLYWVFFSSVLFYAASYFARGFLAGSQRFGLFVALILSESCFRTIFAVMVAIGILSGQSAVAIGITAAPALSLLVVPFAFARRAESRLTVRRLGGRPEAEDFLLQVGRRLRRRRAGDHVQRTGVPQRRPADHPRPAGRGGGGLHLQRPDARPGAAAALPVGLDQHPPPPDQTPRQRRPRQRPANSDHTVRMVLLGIAAFTALVVVVVLIAGPKLMQIAFSNKFTYDREGLLLVSVGMGLYLASVTVNQACIAQGQVRRAAVRWIACAALFIGWNFVPLVSNEFRRVEFGFLLAAGVLFALLYYVYRRPHERAEDVPAPARARARPRSSRRAWRCSDENVYRSSELGSEIRWVDTTPS